MNIKQKVEKSEIKNLQKKIEIFVESSLYKEMKKKEEMKNAFKKQIRRVAEQHDARRHVFEELGTVVKFVTKPIYEWDTPALNEYLSDIGILPMVVEVDNKKVKGIDILKAYENEPEYSSFGVSWNKKGKEWNRFSKEDIIIPNDQEMEWYLRRFNHVKKQEDVLLEQYEALKEETMQLLKHESEKKLSHEYGSFYLRKKATTYDVESLMKDFGIDFFIEYGKINRKKLDDFILDGKLKESDLHPFRKEIDRRVDFIIMDIEKEANALEWFHQKMHIAAQNYR